MFFFSIRYNLYRTYEPLFLAHKKKANCEHSRLKTLSSLFLFTMPDYREIDHHALARKQ